MKGRLVLPNILGLAAAGIMILGYRAPWWILRMEGLREESYVFPNLIRGPVTEAIGYRRTPQMQYLVAALVICMGLCVLGSFLPRRKGRVALVLSSILGSLVLWRFWVRIADLASRFEMPVEGEGVLRYSGFDVMRVWSRVGDGFCLMLAGCGLALFAALFHRWLRRPT